MYYHVWQDTVHNDVACITWHSYNNGWVIHTITCIHTMTVDTELYVLAVVLMCMCRHTERTHDTPIFCNWPEISWFCLFFYRVFKNIQKYQTYQKYTSGGAPNNSSVFQTLFKRNSSGHVEPLNGHQTLFFIEWTSNSSADSSGPNSSANSSGPKIQYFCFFMKKLIFIFKNMYFAVFSKKS